MRRRELEKKLRKLGWSFLRHGGSHDIWSKGGVSVQVPRHHEIPEGTARGILKKARR